MGDIILKDSYEVLVYGHSPAAEEIFKALEEFLVLEIFVARGPNRFEGYRIDEQRGFEYHHTGIVPKGISAWTAEEEAMPSVRVITTITDWTREYFDGVPVTKLYVRIEQH